MRDFLKKRWLEVAAVLVALVAVLIVWMLPSIDSASLTQMSTVSVFVSLMRFGIAIIAVFAVLRLLDVVGEFDWRAIYNRMEANATASAVYFGLRFMAVAYLAAVCLS